MRPSTRRASGLALLAGGLLAGGALGLLLLTDRPGLETDYFALTDPWQGRPVHSSVGPPGLAAVADIREALATDVLFSVRWRGWWRVAQAGEHRFALEADDGGYLRIDGEVVADTHGIFGPPRAGGGKELGAGFHAIEIGLYQTLGPSHLEVAWAGPGADAGDATALEPSQLYAARPLALRRALRGIAAAWSRPYRQLAGAAILIGVALVLRAAGARLRGPLSRLSARLPSPSGRTRRAAVALALFVLAFFLTLPYTGTVRGGDDCVYLQAARFDIPDWFFNRYAHVYLLKLFIGLAGGDPFLASRLWWSFVFAGTVAALAVAAGAVGPGLQLGTLAAALFVLLSQTPIFGMIGAAFADYSAMLFVTAAVAVYLHGPARERGDPPRREWHALLIGALTLAAMRSKEVGAILLLLPLLFLLVEGRLAPRRWLRRMAWWTAGAAATLALLVLLDAIVLGDALFTFHRASYAAAKSMNFPAAMAPRPDSDSWLDLLWSPGGHAAALSLRYLWIGVVAAAAGASLRRRRLELRLLHLMPLAFVGALVVLYVRMPHPFGTRMLIPILPVACLMTALLLHYAGLDEVPWRRLSAPAVAVPAALAIAILGIVVVPYRMGRVAAAELLPVGALERFGWRPDLFLVGTLLPAALIALVAVIALAAGSRRARLAALVVALVAVFGLGAEFDRSALAQRWAAQRGELLRYPWQAFEAELDSIEPRAVALSRDLQFRYQMTSVTRGALGCLALGRKDLRVGLAAGPAPPAQVGILSRNAYQQWLAELPEIAQGAVFDPHGLLVLVRLDEARSAHRAAAKARRVKSVGADG